MPKATRKGQDSKTVKKTATPYEKKGVKGKKGDAKGDKKKKIRLFKSKVLDPKYKNLIEKRPRTYGIGGDVRPKGRDLTRYVKWPRYVKVQRQKRVLMHRLKVPPTINQFTKTLDKNDVVTLFSFLSKYKPETRAEKNARLRAVAAAKAKGETVEAPKKPQVLRYGLNNVTTRIEKGEAALVCIAHDVEPVELVIWLPTLCRKMNVPYCIVKGKARLGQLVHKKTATCVALTEKDIKKEDNATFAQICQIAKERFNDAWAEDRRKYGGKQLGSKSRAAAAKRARAVKKQEKARAAAAASAGVTA